MPRSRDYLLGIDLGTSGAKSVLLAADGRVKACAESSYDIDTPRPGWAEQDPQVWVQAALQTAGEALRQADVPPRRVAGIGLSGQMHTMLCLDEAGNLLRPAILWADQRSQAQVERVYRQIGREKLGEWSGNPLATGFTLASWLWLCENEAETARSTRRLALPKDYLRYRLIGAWGSEPSDASSTLLFDPIRRTWSAPLLEALGIPADLLPPVRPSAETAGGLLAEVAHACGLAPGTPVVYGGSDQALQALAQGVIEPGVLSCTIGTGGQLFAPLRAPRYDPKLRVHLFCHAAPHLWHLEAAILAAGLALKWLRDGVLENKSYQELADLAALAPPGAEGLFFLPDLAGERTPHMDPSASGAFYGLTLRHRREHLVRAVMEGVVLALRQGLEVMREMGTPVERIVASGGGTRHSLWLQLQADIFDCPIYQTETVQPSATGAALLAGVGTGMYADVEDACRKTVRWRDEVTRPNPENVDVYARAYSAYSRLYPALRQVRSEAV